MFSSVFVDEDVMATVYAVERPPISFKAVDHILAVHRISSALVIYLCMLHNLS